MNSPWALIYTACAAAAFFLGLLFTAIARVAAPKLGLWDKPQSEGHKNHSRPVPEAGGVAMWLAWIITIGGGFGATWLAKTHFAPEMQQVIGGFSAAWKTLAVIAGGATVLAAAGLRDDVKPMKAATKFAWQFLVALATAILGPHILAGLCPLWISWLLTALWIATVINALNFFDNMDGLAGGTAAIAFFFLFAVAALHAQFFVSLFNLAALGAALGFLVFNKPPAKIFMGDCGSHFLGYLLAVSCILTTFFRPDTSLTATPLLIPPMILIVPLLDALTVVLIRLHLRQSIFKGDNRHISHRFVNLGLSRAKAVLLVNLLSFIAGAGALALIWLPAAGAALIIAQILAMMAIILIIQFFANHAQ